MKELTNKYRLANHPRNRGMAAHTEGDYPMLLEEGKNGTDDRTWNRFVGWCLFHLLSVDENW